MRPPASSASARALTLRDRLARHPTAAEQVELRLAVRAWVLEVGQPASGAVSAAEPVHRALQALARARCPAVALYGAGLHAAGAADALATSPVPWVAVADDAARPLGPGVSWSTADRFLGFPRVQPAALLQPPPGQLAPAAVVLCSDKHEDVFWEKTQPHRSAGLRVIRLYGTSPEAVA